ncbi:MAG TPA: DUF4136 domain-containing protein [Planctomycetota bacterium]
MLRRLALIAVGLGGCSGLEVGHDYDRSQDFSALRTWAWAPSLASEAENGARLSRLERERIQKAIAGELTGRGYPEADVEAADFRIRYDAEIGPRVGWAAPDGRPYPVDQRVVDQGTLIVDVFTRENDRLVWRGAARMIVDFGLTPEERDARVRDAVRAIFEKFPPPSL